ncbi:hypothetical protein VA249_45420 (plasmid) [Vibrio alfacsensis]|uniref:hypothetical protein n=1 Tax=Vibrio alfacsensis TaxID=1074311 RepID=UPI001BF11948|nr:hypothetical protein [Vibrio alfacsensis]BBM67896.1 hypothetical protein VA249_45420 [Vibrio alfacsensis]
MTINKDHKINDLKTRISEVVQCSNELNIPISIALELGDNVKHISNHKDSGTEQYANIRTLHELKGDVADFLLAICKVQDEPPLLNNVKSENEQADFTMTNTQVLTTFH